MTQNIKQEQINDIYREIGILIEKVNEMARQGIEGKPDFTPATLEAVRMKLKEAELWANEITKNPEAKWANS